jgi:ribonuclease R
MFMVEANEAVASILDRHNIPAMRRVHPDPNALSLMNMARLLRAMGIPTPKSPDRRTIQSILDFTKGTERSLAVNLVVLRSLERAVYAPSHIGHFALASKHYCHFTSPIRRYADLLVHRMLQYCLEDRIEAAKQAVAGQDLFAVGTHLTFTEERADDAEQELKTVLMLQMLSKKLGEELACVVTGLTGFGIFVQSEKFGIEGLIKFEDLGPDHWQLNKVAQCVVGEHSGESIHLGQPMHVRIVSVNIPARQLNLAPVEPLGQARRPVRTGKAGRKGKRKARR